MQSVPSAKPVEMVHMNQAYSNNRLPSDYRNKQPNYAIQSPSNSNTSDVDPNSYSALKYIDLSKGEYEELNS